MYLLESLNNIVDKSFITDLRNFFKRVKVEL